MSCCEPGAPLIPRSLRLWLARRGRRVEALASPGGFQDPVLLSRAGLYRHAVRRFRADPSAAHAFPGDHVRALLGAGKPHAALEAGRIAAASSDPGLALALAGVAPGLALDRYRGGDFALQAGMKAASGDEAGALAAAAQASSPMARLLEASIHRGHPERADAAWAAAFSAWDLTPPQRVEPDHSVTVLNARAETAGDVSGDLVSVIMPSRNVASYIGAAVRSVLNQSWRNLELLVVNDASTDDTADAARAAGAGDARLEVIDRESRSGAYGARNAALARARGRWVMIQDADEWSHPQRIERQIAAMRARGLIASSGLGIRVDGQGVLRARGIHPLARWAPSTLMFERAPVLERAGVFDRVLSGADSEFWWRLSLLFGPSRVAIVREPWILGAWREDSLTVSGGSGFGREGYNLDRLRYWEAWTRWHVRHRRDPGALRVTGEDRPFPIPSALVL